MLAYYNENDPFSAQWLRELIKEGAIPNGEVDERDIREVIPADLAGFTQCHFFAGIGTWAYALKQAGWNEEEPVWTGSCPCQPFSAAGQRKGFTDDRHLWPVFFELIRQCKPDVVFGEQVASKDGLDWIDLVSADLESEAYSIGAVDTCAAGFGAPHIRQRMYWVADADSERWQRRSQGLHSGEHPVQTTGRCTPCRMGDAVCKGLERHAAAGATSERERERVDTTARQAFIVTQVRKTHSGDVRIGCFVETKSGARLNPEFSRWLMGLPPVWGSCGDTVTQLLLRKRKRL